MKKVKKNMFHYSVVSLEVIVLMVLFLSVPVSAQDGAMTNLWSFTGACSTQTNPMMHGYTQTNPFVYGATQTNPAHGPSSPNTASIPEPLEYLDSSWKDTIYWYRLNMEVYGWRPGITSNYNIPNIWDTGSFTGMWSPMGSGGGYISTYSTCYGCGITKTNEPKYPWEGLYKTTGGTCGPTWIGCGLIDNFFGGDYSHSGGSYSQPPAF